MINNKNNLILYIITGLSGAGKSLAIKIFEDAGFFCIDNLPPALLTKLTQICLETNGKIKRLAITIDIRSLVFLSNFFEIIEHVKTNGAIVKVLFLDASDEVLIRRFSETRRKHPLNSGKPIIEDIKFEREMLNDIKDRADYIINTSSLQPKDLQNEIRKLLETDSLSKLMSLIFISFGFKYGLPLDCDIILDVRFLPNPFYIPELKELSGLDSKVYKYVVDSEMGKQFLEKTINYLNFLIPQFLKEPKSRLQIGIGCTGGRHRSVAIAEYLYKEIKHSQVENFCKHRDIDIESR